MNVGSLFSGIGGLDLGLERAGMRVLWQSELDPYASAVLARHWPHVPNLGDVRAIDWASVAPVELLAGGFPCQPVSGAGNRKAQEDERWLWPEFLRAIRHLRPPHVLVENVVGLFARGISTVLGDLAANGYDARWDCISAEALGAPHRRVRVLIHAWRATDTERGELRDQPGRRGQQGPEGLVAQRQGPAVAQHDGDEGRVAGWLAEPERADWWAAEPGICRVADGVPRRVDRLKCLGNAVVPQVAEEVGRRIMSADPYSRYARGSDG